MSQMLVLLLPFGFTFFSSGFFIRTYDDVFDYIPSNKILCFRKTVGKKSTSAKCGVLEWNLNFLIITKKLNKLINLV